MTRMQYLRQSIITKQTNYRIILLLIVAYFTKKSWIAKKLLLKWKIMNLLFYSILHCTSYDNGVHTTAHLIYVVRSLRSLKTVHSYQWGWNYLVVKTETKYDHDIFYSKSPCFYSKVDFAQPELANSVQWQGRRKSS
mgnify:CR=1 FL=1